METIVNINENLQRYLSRYAGGGSFILMRHGLIMTRVYDWRGMDGNFINSFMYNTTSLNHTKTLRIVLNNISESEHDKSGSAKNHTIPSTSPPRERKKKVLSRYIYPPYLIHY